MRTYLTFLLVSMLSLNASYVASVGLCSALEHTASHAAHFGHHSHEHSDDGAHDDHQVNADEAGKVTSVSDHYHHHVHPSFSSILPDTIGIAPLLGVTPMVATPFSTFISVSHILLERPPRASLA